MQIFQCRGNHLSNVPFCIPNKTNQLLYQSSWLILNHSRRVCTQVHSTGKMLSRILALQKAFTIRRVIPLEYNCIHVFELNRRRFTVHELIWTKNSWSPFNYMNKHVLSLWSQMDQCHERQLPVRLNESETKLPFDETKNSTHWVHLLSCGSQNSKKGKKNCAFIDKKTKRHLRLG